jgi:hypothetical protein
MHHPKDNQRLFFCLTAVLTPPDKQFESDKGHQSPEIRSPQQKESSLVSSTSEGRNRYFERIASGAAHVFIAITGLPAAGKSYVMQIVGRELKILTPDRFIPRGRRASDPATEIEWTGVQQASGVEWKTKIFGHQPFPGKWYAFSKQSVVRSYNNQDGNGVFLQVGHPIDIPTLADSVRQLFPLAPFASLHVYAPIEVIQKRLTNDRPDSSAEEIQQRLGLIEQRQLEDDQHMPLVAQAYGTTTLINYKPDEAAAYGNSSAAVKPLSSDLIESLAKNAIQSARARSQKIAANILTPIEITLTDPRIPPSMVDVIQQQILPALDAEGISPAIFAGLGAVLYGSPRRVSDDFDFETPWSRNAAENICRALTRATGEMHEMEVFKWDIAPCWGARCSLLSSPDFGNKTVAIDANLIPRFCESSESFCYEFPYDSQAHFLRRTATLPNGSEIGLVSPERILVHKLIMGRGVEVDKFDLLDCAAILAKQELDPSVLHKLLHTQKFRVECDGIAVDHPRIQERFLELDLGRGEGVDQFLREHGVSIAVVRENLIKWLSSVDDTRLIGEMPSEDVIYRKLSAIKQVAMACRMIQSLDKIVDQMHDPVDLWSGPSTYAQCFNESELRERVASVRAQFMFYACYEIGQQNVTHFISRGVSTDGSPGFRKLSFD